MIINSGAASESNCATTGPGNRILGESDAPPSRLPKDEPPDQAEAPVSPSNRQAHINPSSFSIVVKNTAALSAPRTAKVRSDG